MRKKVEKSLLVFSTLFLLFFISIGTAFANEIKVYRLYNNSNGEHLYTTSTAEVNAITKNGWFNEGTAWISPSEGDPVFRLYHPGNGMHLYTTDQNEINVLTSSHGWVMDFSGQPIFYSGGSVPIYRLYYKGNSLHLLTTDVNEYQVLPSRGWNQEGASIYAESLSNESLTPPPAVTPSTPTPSPSTNNSVTQTTRTYILNTNSGKFHYPSCPSVSRMSNKNKQTFTGTREEVISRGFVACKNCNP